LEDYEFPEEVLATLPQRLPQVAVSL
jgi:hypothetical protein